MKTSTAGFVTLFLLVFAQTQGSATPDRNRINNPTTTDPKSTNPLLSYMTSVTSKMSPPTIILNASPSPPNPKSTNRGSTIPPTKTSPLSTIGPTTTEVTSSTVTFSSWSTTTLEKPTWPSTTENSPAIGPSRNTSPGTAPTVSSPGTAPATAELTPASAANPSPCTVTDLTAEIPESPEASTGNGLTSTPASPKNRGSCTKAPVLFSAVSLLLCTLCV